MKATDILRQDHELVLLVLDGAEREAREIRKTGKANSEKIAQMLGFFRTFMDKCHHSKEERDLFPRLETCGMPCCDGGGGGGPVAVMLYEHDLGRNEVAGIATALDEYKSSDSAAGEAICEHLNVFVRLLREHIDKENNVLFEMADQLLSPSNQEELRAAFVAIEAEAITDGLREQYHRFADELINN